MSYPVRFGLALLAAVYVVAVLTADTLAAQRVEWLIDWRDLHWSLSDLHRWLWSVTEGWGVELGQLSWLQDRRWQSFDVFKFAFWLLLPLLFCLPRMEWAWLGLRRMRGSDWLGLMMIAAAGGGAMAIIPMVPELRQTYPGLGYLPGAARWEYFQLQLFWILSWLIGWEFLHRYVLLRAVSRISPAWGWLLVPLCEGAYHLQKPLLEAGGMVLLSLLLTHWTLRRRTLMPALLAHLLIELELLAYQLL